MQIEDFKLNDEKDRYFNNLDLHEKTKLLEVVEEMYNRFGQLLVYSYLDSPVYIEQNWQLADDENHDMVKTEILDDPYRIHIFINQIPEHIRVYRRTTFSKEVSFPKERQRWLLIMNTVFRSLKKQGVKPFGEEKVVVIYKYHFKKTGDSDNYTTRIINNTFTNVGLIKDDNINCLATYCDGVVNPDNPGIEITLLRQADFASYYHKI